MVLRQLVKRGRNNLAVDRPPDVGDFFRALIYQKYNKMNVGMVRRNRVCNRFEDCCFARFRRGHDNRPLTFADWGD